MKSDALRAYALSASTGERAGVRCRILSPHAAIQSAPTDGYSDWLAADEAALDYIATRIAPKFGVSAEADLPQSGQKKIAQGCSHNLRATLDSRPAK